MAARPATPCRSAPRSIALWKEIADEAGEGLGIRTEGGLMLAEDEAAIAWLRAKSAMETALRHRKPRDRRQRAAHAGPGAVRPHGGADFVPAEGCIDPLRGTAALLRLAQQAGARLLRGAEVHRHRARR